MANTIPTGLIATLLNQPITDLQSSILQDLRLIVFGGSKFSQNGFVELISDYEREIVERHKEGKTLTLTILLQISKA